MDLASSQSGSWCSSSARSLSSSLRICDIGRRSVPRHASIHNWAWDVPRGSVVVVREGHEIRRLGIRRNRRRGSNYRNRSSHRQCEWTHNYPCTKHKYAHEHRLRLLLLGISHTRHRGKHCTRNHLGSQDSPPYTRNKSFQRWNRRVQRYTNMSSNHHFLDRYSSNSQDDTTPRHMRVHWYIRIRRMSGIDGTFHVRLCTGPNHKLTYSHHCRRTMSNYSNDSGGPNPKHRTQTHRWIR